MVIHQKTVSTSSSSFEQAMQAERGQLVRLCTRLTGNSAAAEDLAQEALLEAWRSFDRMYESTPPGAWIAGCARNVCRRFLQQQGKELARIDHSVDLESDLALPILRADSDWEYDLERDDLITLLDQALALLPAHTQQTLIQHYVDELPQREIATRLGASEGAIAVRIHRGRIALREALSRPEFASLAATFGLHPITDDGWQITRIWCPECGKQRLRGYFSEDHAAFQLQCPTCHEGQDVFTINCTNSPDLLAGISAFKPAFSRCATYVETHFRASRDRGAARCSHCGTPIVLRDGMPADMPARYHEAFGSHYRCESCQRQSDVSLAALVLWSPAGRAFWRTNPRIHLLPEQLIEYHGRPAVLTRYECITTAAQFHVVSARNTFQTLAINDVPAE